MRTNVLPIAVAGALALVVLPAHAQWYAGISAGGSEARLDSSLASQLGELGFADPVTSRDDRDTAWRLHAGWQPHRNFALELGYADLGRFRLRADVQPAGRLVTSVEPGGLDLSVVGILPLQRLSLFARGGAYWSRTESQYVGTGSLVVIEGQGNPSKTSSGWVWGAGAVFWYSPQLGIRAEYARYEKLQDGILLDDFSADTITAGIQWRF